MGRKAVVISSSKSEAVPAESAAAVCDPKQPPYIGDCSNLSEKQKACVTDAYALIDAKYDVTLQHPELTQGMDSFEYKLQTVQWTFGICTPQTVGGRSQHGSLAVRLMRENDGKLTNIKCVDGGCHSLYADEKAVRGRATEPTDKPLLPKDQWVFYPRTTMQSETDAPYCNSCHPAHNISGRPLASNAFGVNVVFDGTSANSSTLALPPMIPDVTCDSCHVTSPRPPATSAADTGGSQSKRTTVERTQTQPCQMCHQPTQPEEKGERK